MDNLEVIARLKIRPGQLEGFKSQWLLCNWLAA
jgi:hypothetical protein